MGDQKQRDDKKPSSNKKSSVKPNEDAVTEVVKKFSGKLIETGKLIPYLIEACHSCKSFHWII